MNLQKTSLGYEITRPELTVFFGGIHAQLDALKSAYPHFDFTRVKQTHSDIVVESVSDEMDFQIIADSHFSNAKNLALCVITADCVPVLFYHPPTGLIAAVHAGWRGIANQIIPKTLNRVIKNGIQPQQIQVIIGPHIQKNSFEVGLDVRDQILASLDEASDIDVSDLAETTSPEKAHVDLNKIVRSQLVATGIEMENIFDLHIDTFSDGDFHSHRRDKEKAGRQISFICRTQ